MCKPVPCGLLTLTLIQCSTTADIWPRSLCPQIQGETIPFATRVDFAYTLRTRPLLRSFIYLPIIDGEKAYNHTRFQQTQNAPIFISIETKSARGDSLADTQLGVSAIAHHNKLLQLMEHKTERDSSSVPDEVELPVLPLLIANGSAWTLLIASRRDWGSTVRPSSAACHQ